MLEEGWGRIVNISSRGAFRGEPRAPAYGASKAGVELLTRVWADEFGRSGVRVNAVQPGPAETPGTDATPGLTDAFAAYTALGRAACPTR